MYNLSIYKYDIVFQEVPNEISLAFYVYGCPNNCKNCSWKSYSHKYYELTERQYIKLLKKYQNYASCVLFLGGEWDNITLLKNLKIAKEMNYKTCLYTGLYDVSKDLKENLDYLKTGPYIEELGGLNKITTNQRFYDLKNNKLLNHYFTEREL